MLNIRRLGAFLSALAVSAVALGQAPSPVPENYRLEPGDLLTVSVWKEQDLTGAVRIRPDGGLSFPLAGDLKAAGLTIDELRNALQVRVRKLVPEAEVTVSVKAPQRNSFFPKLAENV